MGPMPGLRGEIVQFGSGLTMQAGGRSRSHPAAGGREKRLLVHRLVGTAILQTPGTVGGEQQQRLGGAIGLHRRRQQIGDRSAGGGDHSHRPSTGRGQAEGNKCCRALINSGGEQQIAAVRQQPGGQGQGSGAAAGAEHQSPQPMAVQGAQQGEGGLQIGAGDRQDEEPGWCDLRSTMTNPTTPSEAASGKRLWLNLILWALLALLLRWVVIEPRWIPSGSMLPTLQLNDRILVEKLRPRISHSRHGHLHRGDVVVFAPPSQLVAAGYDPKAALIKRVVGLPGDELAVDEGVLRRNGAVVEEPWLREAITYAMEPVTVPDDALWVMGDNRNASLDSHLWGPLPETNVIGTAIWRYWPPNRFGPLRIPANNLDG